MPLKRRDSASWRLAVSIAAVLMIQVGHYSLQAEGAEPAAFVLKFVDETTGRPVPLVEVSTVHGVSHISDNDGVTAWTEPELIGEEVFFLIESHGYEMQADGFGFRDHFEIETQSNRQETVSDHGGRSTGGKPGRWTRRVRRSAGRDASESDGAGQCPYDPLQGRIALVLGRHEPAGLSARKLSHAIGEDANAGAFRMGAGSRHSVTLFPGSEDRLRCGNLPNAR